MAANRGIPSSFARAPGRFWNPGLRLGIAVGLIGLACSQLWADLPYRSLLWDERLLGPILEALFGLSWEDWVTNTALEVWLERYAWLAAGLFAVAACGLLAPLRGRAVWLPVLAAAPPLVGYAWAIWAEHGYYVSGLLELGIRLSLPLAVWILLRHPAQGAGRWQLRLCLVGCAATFVGHGLHALDWAPTPLAFVDMLRRVLGIGGDAADWLLLAIGIQDLLLAVALCWPRLRGPALLWMACWGALTALARLSLVDLGFIADTLLPALATTLERVPHAILPLACWWWWQTVRAIGKPHNHAPEPTHDRPHPAPAEHPEHPPPDRRSGAGAPDLAR